jgi:hypothetical protein
LGEEDFGRMLVDEGLGDLLPRLAEHPGAPEVAGDDLARRHHRTRAERLRTADGGAGNEAEDDRRRVETDRGAATVG